MDRRKFIKFGGVFSAATAVMGVNAVQAEKPVEDLPRFEQGQILTHEQLNALVDRINELNKRV